MTSNDKDLPDELYTDHITPYFKNNSKELSQLALTSNRFYKLFQPKRLVATLLNYIAFGNQEAAKKILIKHPELMVETGSVIDPSGRHFKRISAFELVLWALDVRYMAGMMLVCIPKNKEGNTIRKQLLLQYNNVENRGVTYTVGDQTVTESHFNFKPMIDALNSYIKNYHVWSHDERKNHWCTVIGKEQIKLPMHVRHHYCDPDESFKSTPTFDKKELKRHLKFYNWSMAGYQTWAAGLPGLGVDFGILRGGRLLNPRACVCVQHITLNAPAEVQLDFSAISRLCEVRIKDLDLLKKQLEYPIQKSFEIQKSYCTMS